MGGYLYVSSVADEAIYVYRCDGAKLEPAGCVPVPGGPRRILFTRDRRRVVLSTQNARLLLLDVLPCGNLAVRDDMPVPYRYTHTAFTAGGDAILGASYNGGCVGIHALGADGKFDRAGQEVLFTDAAAHYIIFGGDKVHFYVPHPDVRRLFKLRVCGPGHIAIVESMPLETDVRHMKRAGGDYFGISYMDNEISRWRESGGRLRLAQRASSLPGDFSGFSIGSEIKCHPRLPLLYAANRGADNLAVADRGTLRALGFIPLDPEPIDFCLSDDGALLFSAGKLSGRVCVDRLSPDGVRSLERHSLPTGREVMWMTYAADSPGR